MGQFDRKKQSQPKHGKPMSSGSSKAPVVVGSRQRPAWSGPTYLHKKPKPKPRPNAQSTAQEAPVLEEYLPVELQQLILDIFRSTFPASGDFEALKPTLREINEALSQGDLEQAFAREELLEAYAIRWSPSRSLAYANLLAWINGKLSSSEEGAEDGVRDAFPSRLLFGDSQGLQEQRCAKVICLGGGVSEIMALSALLRLLRPDTLPGRPREEPLDKSPQEALERLYTSDETHHENLVDLRLVDAMDWSPVLSKLYMGLTTPPVLSKYASAAARAANGPFITSQAMKYTSHQNDIFQLGVEDLQAMIGWDPALVTLFLTLNDLYTSSIPKTTTFLRKLTQVVPQGSQILVVDTPDAGVEVAVNRASKGSDDGEDEKMRYSMSWLLDNTLVPSPRKTEGIDASKEEKLTVHWQKVLDENNVKNRLREGLRYPASLENLKFQVHLYKRL